MHSISMEVTRHYDCDVLVIGGGVSGFSAAVNAARSGANVILAEKNGYLGGNSSSEIRMWVRGAKGENNRETGLLAEFEEENIYRNPKGMNANKADDAPSRMYPAPQHENAVVCPKTQCGQGFCPYESCRHHCQIL